MRETIEVGYQTFVSDRGEEFGAIREIISGRFGRMLRIVRQ